jgi:hypothetical protein
MPKSFFGSLSLPVLEISCCGLNITAKVTKIQSLILLSPFSKKRTKIDHEAA